MSESLAKYLSEHREVRRDYVEISRQMRKLGSRLSENAILRVLNQYQRGPLMRSSAFLERREENI